MGNPVDVQLDLADRRRDPDAAVLWCGQACSAVGCLVRHGARAVTLRLDGLSDTRVAWRSEAGTRHRHALDRRQARLAVLDRAEGAGSAERKPALAVDEGGRMLARLDLRDLSGAEIGHLDLAADHVHAGAGGIHGDAKLGALDDGGEVGGLDLEMPDVALFDLEQDRPGLLHDRGRQPFLLLGGHADHRIRRDHHGFFAALEQDAAVLAGADGIAWLQKLFLPERGRLGATVGEPDFTGGLADRPFAVIGGKGARSCREDERCRQQARNVMGRTHEGLSPVAGFSQKSRGKVSTLREREHRNPDGALTVH